MWIIEAMRPDGNEYLQIYVIVCGWNIEHIFGSQGNNIGHTMRVNI